MAINFPSSNLYNGYTHVVGDVTFTYNSTKTLWEPSTAAATIHDTPVDGSSTIAISSNWAFDSVKTNVPTGALFTDTTGSSVDIDDNPPTSPSAGDLWINSTSMKLNVYYDDGGSLQWVETNTAGSNNYVDGVSLVGGSTLTLTRSGTLGDLTTDLSSLSGLEGMVTDATFVGRDLTLLRSGGVGNLTVNIPAATNTSAINEVEYIVGTASGNYDGISTSAFPMAYDPTEDTLTLYINGVKQAASTYTAVLGTGTANNINLTVGNEASATDEVTIVVVSTLFVNEQIVGKSGNNGQAFIPAGTTAQRTTHTTAQGGMTGHLRFNTDNINLEVYDQYGWWRQILQSGTNFEYEKIHPKSVTMTNTTIDLDNNNIFKVLTGTTSFGFTNYTSAGRTTILHIDRTTSGYTFNWPGVVRWAGGTEPTWTDHRDWIINMFCSGANASNYVFCSATGYNR